MEKVRLAASKQKNTVDNRVEALKGPPDLLFSEHILKARDKYLVDIENKEIEIKAHKMDSKIPSDQKRPSDPDFLSLYKRLVRVMFFTDFNNSSFVGQTYPHSYKPSGSDHVLVRLQGWGNHATSRPQFRCLTLEAVAGNWRNVCDFVDFVEDIPKGLDYITELSVFRLILDEWLDGDLDTGAIINKFKYDSHSAELLIKRYPLPKSYKDFEENKRRGAFRLENINMGSQKGKEMLLKTVSNIVQYLDPNMKASGPYISYSLLNSIFKNNSIKVFPEIAKLVDSEWTYEENVMSRQKTPTKDRIDSVFRRNGGAIGLVVRACHAAESRNYIATLSGEDALKVVSIFIRRDIKIAFDEFKFNKAVIDSIVHNKEGYERLLSSIVRSESYVNSIAFRARAERVSGLEKIYDIGLKKLAELDFTPNVYHALANDSAALSKVAFMIDKDSAGVFVSSIDSLPKAIALNSEVMTDQMLNSLLILFLIFFDKDKSPEIMGNILENYDDMRGKPKAILDYFSNYDEVKNIPFKWFINNY